MKLDSGRQHKRGVKRNRRQCDKAECAPKFVGYSTHRKRARHNYPKRTAEQEKYELPKAGGPEGRGEHARGKAGDTHQRDESEIARTLAGHRPVPFKSMWTLGIIAPCVV
jgi:hypothetical protein